MLNSLLAEFCICMVSSCLGVFGNYESLPIADVAAWLFKSKSDFPYTCLQAERTVTTPLR